MADIEAEPSRRVLVSHESAASASAPMARKFVDQLGDGRAHVVITLRSPAAMLPSRWVERLKSGTSVTFEDWLARVYGRTRPPIPERLARTLDLAGLVERWADAAGPENVTVIIADEADKNLLTDAFEDLLGLPARTLTGVVADGADANRSMSLPEAELFRRLNATLSSMPEVPWPVYLYVVRGAVAQVLGQRVPDDEEPRVRMPRWAAELAMEDGRRYAKRIANSGVRIVGDLENLHRARPVRDETARLDESWPSSLAVEALTGAVLGTVKVQRRSARGVTTAQDGTGPGGDLGQSRAQGASSVYTTHELLEALSIRVRHRLRTRRSKPVGIAPP
ncbi:hypothetical protein ABE437_04005 [Isoptericola cucumis]|uniref:hypothetical protein n=1 Tax=Isoptericola cucumis TaxID=1776856 RepID=UPI0032078850